MHSVLYCTLYVRYDSCGVLEKFKFPDFFERNRALYIAVYQSIVLPITEILLSTVTFN